MFQSSNARSRPHGADLTWATSEGSRRRPVEPGRAARLFLPQRTVEVHVPHILTKLDARSRFEVAREVAVHANT